VDSVAINKNWRPPLLVASRLPLYRKTGTAKTRNYSTKYCLAECVQPAWISCYRQLNIQK
jgi:hypothetical protein